MTSAAYQSGMRHLPPLAAVRVFEAAARHENFTAAAAELGMTQAAVSYQIRILEERLGAPLFRREKRRVHLTEAGRRAAAPVTQAFDAIDGAFAQVRSEDEAMLGISTSQTFASTWLAFRLGSFQMGRPDMAVRLMVSDALVDFAVDEVDVAIRAGLGPWPGLDADLLIKIDFTPMCSPAFLARHGGRIGPADLLELPMISPHDPWWQWWLGEAGVTVADGRVRPGIRMDSQANEGSAAIAGQGVAMLTPFFWRNDLAEGRLVRPFDQVSTRGYAYWLVAPEHRRSVPKIKRFREWLLAEVRRDLAGEGPSPRG
jgi:LysR family glycine cleavage system transcriptional activator